MNNPVSSEFKCVPTNSHFRLKALKVERLMLTAQLKCCPVSSEIKDFVSNEGDEYGQLNLRAEVLIYEVP